MKRSAYFIIVIFSVIIYSCKESSSKPPASAGFPASRTASLKEITDAVPDTIAMSGIKANIIPVAQMPPSSKQKPFTRINKILFLDDVKYVLDLRGKLYAQAGRNIKTYIGFDSFPNFINTPGLATGFGSFALHPDFKSNGLIYTTHTEKARSQKADFAIADSIKTTLQWVLTEWKASNPQFMSFKGTHRELLRIDMVSGVHGMQEICFRKNSKKTDEDYGLLYIGIGDGGATDARRPYIAHHTNAPWGAILRIDPSGNNSANGKYGIPKQNPFVNDPNKLGEIYAYGFRNPNRITWTESGLMLVTNIGQAHVESVNIVDKGDDFGWPQREGPFVFNYDGDIFKIFALPANDSVNHFTYPAAMFDHDEGASISGGFEYTGIAAPELKGKYLFGDIITGRVFYVEINDLKRNHLATIRELQLMRNNKPVSLLKLCKDFRVDLHFAQNEKGEIYILSKSDGMIYKLI